MIERANYHRICAYLRYLSEVRQVSALTLKTYRSQLRLFLEWADSTPFEKVPALRPTFPAFLKTMDSNQDGRPITHAHAVKCCNMARAFLVWLRAEDSAFAKLVPQSYGESLNMGRPEGREKLREYYTLVDVLRLVALPGDTIRDLRDRAAIAFLFLSGMRVGAFATMPRSAVDLAAHKVRQWPELGMHTKNSKAATTYLLDIPELLAVVKQWDDFLRTRLPDNALWFAPLDIAGRLTGATEASLERRHSVMDVLRTMCDAAGVQYRSVHKLRHGHTMYALAGATTVADLKAISQNLMHSSLQITDSIYGVLGTDDVGSRIGALGKHNGNGGSDQHAASDAAVDAAVERALAKFISQITRGA